MAEGSERVCGTSPWFLPVLLCMALTASVEAQEVAGAVDARLPELSDLEEGWNTLYPGGETTCAHGDDFLFYARAADPDRLVVYLYGGGGCWDAETCDPDRDTYTYTSTINPARHPDRSSGIFDLEHPENPVASYSMVAVPVCTGDTYLGDRDVTYTMDTESGDTRQFTIHTAASGTPWPPWTGSMRTSSCRGKFSSPAPARGK
jgi:hypothetical protein